MLAGSDGEETGDARMRVALFATCLGDTLFPAAPKATVQLLERLGCEVDFPAAQTCCGQMHTNTGYRKQAKSSVRTFVDAFADYDAVVAPSGSCVASVRHQHLHERPLQPSHRVPGLSPRLDDLVMQLLEKKPAERPGYAVDVAVALAEMGVAGVAEAGPPPRPYLYPPGLLGRGP